MTFLAPVFLAAGAAAALAVVALHFLSFETPRPRALPTARFLPDRPVRSVASFRRPTDLLLLLLRALALLLVGAAFARPVRPAPEGAVARVLLVDRSRAAASAEAVTAALRAHARPGDALVWFDSAAAAAVRVGEVPPTLAALTGAAGSLSAALTAAGRAARVARENADSVELVLVSPLRREEVDAATVALRRGWPGRVRLVDVPAATPARAGVGAVELRADGSADPLSATHALLPAGRVGAAAARIVRDPPTAADSLWLAAAADRRLVVWPRAGAPAGWTSTAGDTVGAVVAGAVAVVAPLPRPARAPAGGAVVARWVDGEPAATERAAGAGCVREVGVVVPGAGDLVLAPQFARFVAALAGPCGAPRDLRPVDAATRAALAGGGPLAAARAVGGEAARRSPLAPWLLGAAGLALVAELLVRRRGPGVAA